jgi:hypothetical protein
MALIGDPRQLQAAPTSLRSLDGEIAQDRSPRLADPRTERRALISTTTPAPFDVTFSDPDRLAQRAGVVGTIERAVRLDGVLKYRRD